jgi:hypothetical protein
MKLHATRRSSHRLVDVEPVTVPRPRASTSDIHGREARMSSMDVAVLADLLRETAGHHDPYENTHPEHNWLRARRYT